MFKQKNYLAFLEKKSNVENKINNEIIKIKNKKESLLKIASICDKNTLKKGFLYLQKHGIKQTILKIFDRHNGIIEILNFASKDLFSPSELENQRMDLFSKDITISILVPLYNTNSIFLNEMIESVFNQTYSKWELCLADGSDENHAYVRTICENYAESDSRIKYKKLDENLGISSNTNECIRMSTGEYLALFDHDDLLHPAALHEVMKAICNGNADYVYTDEAAYENNYKNAFYIHLKPDYAPDSLLVNNYICHFSVFSRDILKQIELFRSEYDGSQDHDFILRATDVAKCVAHIPEVLYYWRSHQESVAHDIGAKPYAVLAGRKASSDFLQSKGKKVSVSSTDICPTIYRISYELKDKPLVSILIPNKDHCDILKKCIESIISKSTYDNYEIVIIENNSEESKTFEYYDSIQKDNRNIKVVKYEGGYNYSKINNFGENYCSGEILVLLNNDTEVISSNWIEEMLMYATRENVGAVGAKLYYSNGTIQHAGIKIAEKEIALHYFYQVDGESAGYVGRLGFVQNVSAVTGACLMVRRNLWNELKGLDEELQVAYNDVDFCLRLRAKGYLNIWTPFAELFHKESLTRGYEDSPQKIMRLLNEQKIMKNKWGNVLEYGDPYYNVSFMTGDALFRYADTPQKSEARYTYKISDRYYYSGEPLLR